MGHLGFSAAEKPLRVFALGAVATDAYERDRAAMRVYLQADRFLDVSRRSVFPDERVFERLEGLSGVSPVGNIVVGE
jgi:hypothetical protein